MPKISFIIVNYSTKILLEQCINNLLKVQLPHEIVAIDNNSPDGSYEYAKNIFKDYKNVHLVPNKNNGLSAGYNLAIKKAKGDIHIYLGTDAFPTNKAINEIYEYMINNNDVGIVSPHLYTRDGKSDLDSHRGFPTPWVSFTHFSGLEKLFKNVKIFNGYYLGYKDLNTTHQIDAGISHFLAVNPKVYEKAGIWDEKFFLFGEDIDFCYRVKKAGFKVMFLGTTKVLHYKGASISRKTSQDIKNAMNMDFSNDQNSQELSQNVQTKKTNNKNLKILIAKQSTSAMRYFYKKHYSKKYNFIISFFIIIGTYILQFIRVAKIKLK